MSRLGKPRSAAARRTATISFSTAIKDDAQSARAAPQLSRGGTRRTATRLQLNAFDHDHFSFCGAMAHFSWLAVFFAVEPLFGALDRFKLEHDHAFRLPIAF